MPSLFVHQYVAQAVADNIFDLPATPAFYLGNTAPDAVHTRADSDVAMHHRYHLRSGSKADHEKEILDTLHGLDHPDDFMLGYITHVLTDMKTDQLVEAYFDTLRIPKDQRAALYHGQVGILDKKMFQHMPDYPGLADYAASAEQDIYPFGLTPEDLEKEKAVMLHEYDGLSKEASYPDSEILPFATYLDMIDNTAAYIAAVLGHLGA